MEKKRKLSEDVEVQSNGGDFREAGALEKKEPEGREWMKSSEEEWKKLSNGLHRLHNQGLECCVSGVLLIVHVPFMFVLPRPSPAVLWGSMLVLANTEGERRGKYKSEPNAV